MTPERWKQVKTIFQSALEIPTEKRAKFLDEACGQDVALRAEVQSLLDSHEEASQFIEEPADELGYKVLENAANQNLTGKQFGPYQIERELSRGGMGVVYLAARADKAFEKQVAIKIIKRGMDTDEIIRRFQQERQTLANLDHQYIAKLLDGGSTEDGAPFLVMEYIDGLPIDQYCDDNKLTTVQRLQLFRKVCAAVQYAHQNLIIHRDLKPGNILVTSDGKPRLLDFGIAKLLAPASSQDSILHTQTEQRILTPEYASPEQVVGAALTTASDVYSLGVLLYRLLTGHRPYRYQTQQELIDAIKNEEPEKPSIVIRRTEDAESQNDQGKQITPESISETRDGSPEKLRRRLSGDVDNIVLKALRKEPQRRYAFVEQFSEDIRRYLGGLPVLAHKDSLLYRSKKFIRRHKFPVAATFLFFILILSFGILSKIQAEKIAVERDKAEHIAQFLTEMFEEAEPDSAKGKELTAKEILDKGAKKIKTKLNEQPEVQAELMNVIGMVYCKLQYYDSAYSLIEESIIIRKKILGEYHPDVAASYHNLGNIVFYKDDYSTADSLFNEALKIWIKVHGQNHLKVAATLNDIMVIQATFGNYPKADSLIRKVIAIRTNKLGRDNEKVAVSLTNLAWLVSAQGKYKEAEDIYRETLKIRMKRLGLKHTHVASNLRDLASMLRIQGKYQNAIDSLNLAKDIFFELMGEQNTEYALCLNNLGSNYAQLKQLQLADSLYQQALEINRVILGDKNTLVANSLHNIGHVQYDLGNYEKAAHYFLQALQIWPQLLPKDHWRFASTQSRLGECQLASGQFKRAEKNLLESYRIIQSKWGNEQANLEEITLKRVVKLYENWGKPKKAASYRAKLAKITSKSEISNQ